MTWTPPCPVCTCCVVLQLVRENTDDASGRGEAGSQEEKVSLCWLVCARPGGDAVGSTARAAILSMAGLQGWCHFLTS